MGNMDSHVQNPVWREGLQRVVPVESPAAGKEWELMVAQVPEGVWWRVKAVAFRFVASAVVANRQPRVQYRSGSDAYYEAGFPSVPQAAGVTMDYFFAELDASTSPATFTEMNRALPFDFRLQPGHIIGSRTDGLDVGDQYRNVRLYVQEYIYVPPVDYISGALSLAADRIIAAVKANGGCGCPLVVGEAVGSPTS